MYYEWNKEYVQTEKQQMHKHTLNVINFFSSSFSPILSADFPWRHF